MIHPLAPSRLRPLPRLAFLLRRGWQRLRRPLTLGVRVLVRDETGAVLLVRHTYIEGWHLPGGAVDRGETLGQGALRELREEVGLEASAARLLSVHARFGPWGHDHVALFEAGPWQGKPTVQAFEIEEARFFPLEALPADLSPATGRRLRERFKGEPVSERW
ncbi:NUDIX domain-containing protein [Oleisolibacter albus]|uniref:NUDIX domain-containing protein n=1 Tax=Oleisolibacter albus TaxID=2171757 RepID=UPI000DF3CE7E|nr:NUDIX domain-containing protein [Oleisolibacter albus]